MIIKFFRWILLLMAMMSVAYAVPASFQVKQIRIEGLYAIKRATVLSYLGIKPGHKLRGHDTAAIIRRLYATHFFDDVALIRDGDTLIVRLTERRTIGRIRLRGFDTLSTSRVQAMMTDLKFQTGRFYSSSQLAQLQQRLREAYQRMGYYQATIHADIEPAARRHLNITLRVEEGHVARVRQILILGTHAFTPKQIQQQLHMTTSGIQSWFTGSDHYALEKLDMDLEAMKIFYLNHGFIDFKVVSRHISIDPQSHDVYITLRIQEGERYSFSGYQFLGRPLFSDRELQALVPFNEGDVFSRQQVMASQLALRDFYGNHSYVFAKIRVMPEIDREQRHVYMNFAIDPGLPVYVHHIHFEGNHKSADEVLRREMRQMEGMAISLEKIKASERRLYLQGYFKEVASALRPVPGNDNQVDVHFKVKETPSGNANFSIGYSDADGLLYSANSKQPNFLGSGTTFGFGFDNSALHQSYWLNFFDPYYTIDGVGRGFNIFYNRTSPNAANIGRYTLNTMGANVGLSIPLVHDQALQFGAGVQRTELNAQTGAATEVTAFIDDHGRDFRHALFTAGWSRNTLDRAIFPTRGSQQRLSLQISAPLESEYRLTYAKTSYAITGYQPLPRHFIVQWHGQAAYGLGYDTLDRLPFFQHYFAGGIGTVRGFEAYALGPRDSNGRPMGGNLLLTGSCGIVLPAFIHDNVRLTAFVDAGNVFDSQANTVDEGRPSLHEMRYSTGLGIEWRTPIAPLVFSLAAPLYKKAGDHTQFLAFTVGMPF